LKQPNPKKEVSLPPQTPSTIIYIYYNILMLLIGITMTTKENTKTASKKSYERGTTHKVGSGPISAFA
jgi:hypothetical protein